MQSNSHQTSKTYSGNPHYYMDQYDQLLTEAQWDEMLEESDENRQELIIDHQNRDIILEFMNRTYNNADVPSLIEDTDSLEVVRQLRGVIGLRILRSHPNCQIRYSNPELFHRKAISKFLQMAANKKSTQLQLESLRLLNCATNHFHQFDQSICGLIVEAGGVTILTKLLGERNANILSRAILILGNICKFRSNLISLIIKEGIIRLLLSVAENHNNGTIKLQCCWVLSIFAKTHFCIQKIPADYQRIVSFLCKTMMESISTFNPLFYVCVYALDKTSAVNLIIEHRVYQRMLAIDIQTDKTIPSPCLSILLKISLYGHSGRSILIQNGICDFVSKCLCSSDNYILQCCYMIISSLTLGIHQVQILMNHKHLIPKAVELFKTGKVPMKYSKICQIASLFPRIFIHVAGFFGQKLIQFEDALIDLGIIETLVQIMRVNLFNPKITQDILQILTTLLKQKLRSRTCKLYALLQKLDIVSILLEVKENSYNEFVLQKINQIAKHFDLAKRRHI